MPTNVRLRFKFLEQGIPLPQNPVPYSVYVVQNGSTFKLFPVDKQGAYLEATVANLGVETITGDGVDKTDVNNPILSFPNADEVEDNSTTKKFTTQTEKDKLGTIEDNATQNDTDSNLRDRTTHTGEQPISTVTNLQTELDAKATSAQGTLADTALQSGDNISLLTNDSGYITSFTEQNDLTTNVTWINVPDVNITESSITQHESAINITESQISGVIDVVRGGTGVSTITGVVIGNGVNPFTSKINPTGDFLGTTDTQTITNKTISGSNNIISNIDLTTQTTGNLPINRIQLGNTTSTSTNYTALPTDRNINVNASSGNIIVILPTLTNNDSIGLTIKKVDNTGNSVIIETPNTELIDNNNSDSIDEPLRAKTIYNDGTNYWNK